MRFYCVFLCWIFLPLSLQAKNCVSTNVVTKCARIQFYRYYIQDGVSTVDSWSFIYDNHVWSGTEASCQGGKCTCDVISPIYAQFKIILGPGEDFDIPQEACISSGAGMLGGFTVLGRLDGDVCPDGFYTVPYETHCGEGLVDTESVPDCDDDVFGDYCIISSIVECGDGFVLYDNECKELCKAGITMFRTSTGLAVPLFAEKLTTPALNVKYNNSVCYANLVVGSAQNAVNIIYNNTTYHTVE